MDTLTLVEVLDEMIEARVSRALCDTRPYSLAQRQALKARECRRLAHLLSHVMGAPLTASGPAAPALTEAAWHELLATRN
jgi:hypothetical protein